MSPEPGYAPLPTVAERGGRYPMLWWDLAFGAITALMLAIGLVDTWPPGPSLWFAVGTLAVLLLAYGAVGRTALHRASQHAEVTLGGYIFVILLIVLVGAATAVVPSFATLQSIAYPVIWWTMDRYRDAVVACGVLAISTGAGSWAAYVQAGAEDPVLPSVVVAGLSFTFAVVMGTWISRIFARGEQYRALAEQLRTSQAEVSALSLEAGAAAERERISRELHDTLTQTLTGLVMLSEQVDRALAGGQIEHARERLSRVQTASRAALEEARALVATTHPLGDGGLEQAIARVAASLSDDAGLPVSCELEALALDRDRQVVLLRAAQEGLANARRHAQARSATVILQRDGEYARLTVADDGAGPQPATEQGSATGPDVESSGFGLRGLHDRVSLVGGEMRFGARPGGGSCLEVRVPLTPGGNQ